MFLLLSSKQLFIPKIKIEQKLPSYSCKSTSWFIEQKITEGSNFHGHMLSMFALWGFGTNSNIFFLLALLLSSTFGNI